MNHNTQQSSQWQPDPDWMAAMLNAPCMNDPMGMLNVYRPRPTARQDALNAEKKRPWMSKEYERFMAAGGLK